VFGNLFLSRNLNNTVRYLLCWQKIYSDSFVAWHWKNG
jgi:hypothetical protein